MAHAVILARVWVTIVDVEFTILALEPWWAGALVGSNQVFASGSVLTRLRKTFVDLILTIGSVVPFRTDAFMTVSDISTMPSILAQVFH